MDQQGSLSLPDRAADMLDWPWERYAGYYRELSTRTLTETEAGEFLTDWTRLAERVDEVYNRLYVATTLNTADEAARRRFHDYLDQIFPQVEAAEQVLKEKLVQAGLQPPGFELPLSRMHADVRVFRRENLQLQVDEQKLSNEYDQVIGRQTVEWEGKEVTISQLRPVFQDTDRGRREAAWRLSAERQLADRGAINNIWTRLLELRRKMASNASFPGYRAFRWHQLYRFDYTPEDCHQFRHAIEEVIVPAAHRVYERRAAHLGLSRLRPWDLDVDVLGRPPIRAFETSSDLETKVGMVFGQVEPKLGHYFSIMRREGLLDLDNRKDKAPGAYCTSYQSIRRPFVFMNAVGTKEDVFTLLHEGGHAVHVFQTSTLPWLKQRSANLEFSEVASMAMELLALPYLARSKGGFFEEPEMNRAATEKLEKDLLFLPYMAVVDGFQHWVYDHPEEARNPTNCDRCWAQLWQRFMPSVDWSGLENEMMTGWQRKLHILQAPFYYVEYGLAQLGAYQIWARALTDQQSAVAAYLAALALGGTRSLPDLYRAAGARFAFDEASLRQVLSLIEHKLDQWSGDQHS